MYLYVYSSRALESAHSPAMHESIHDASGLTSWSSDCDIFSEDLVSSQHCSVLQSVAMCCSVLQCVAVYVMSLMYKSACVKKGRICPPSIPARPNQSCMFPYR